MEEIKNGHAVIFDAKGNILLTSTSSSSFPWHLFKKPSYATRRIKSANEYWRVVSLPYGLKQDLNWMIAVALPESQFLEPLHIAQLRGGFVYFFGLVIFIILAFFLVRLITEPLRLIRLAVSDYADDSEVPLSHSPESECILKLLAVRQDELGHLAKTFLHLSLSLADSFASLNRSLKEKEIMLKEIHHRVKNNLQIVSSLLSLRAGESSNPELIEELEDVRDRVQAMALVHESIYSTGDFSAVSMDDYLTRVVHGLSAYDRSSGGVSIHLEANDINFTLEKAIPCALIVVELATNAFKHAFKGRSLGSVDVYLTKSDTGFELCVSDDGRGMMGDKKGEGMGQLIVEALCDQLKGQLILDSSERGTQIRIRFP
ncbi:hypothetical protein MASR2M78_35830 [Treponema sp.]